MLRKIVSYHMNSKKRKMNFFLIHFCVFDHDNDDSNDEEQENTWRKTLMLKIKENLIMLFQLN